jgi:hypothetical protein
MWNIPQEDSVKLCNDYRAEGAHCDLMPPALVEQIANVLRASAPPPRPVAQGSDASEPSKKPAKKRVKKKQKSK